MMPSGKLKGESKKGVCRMPQSRAGFGWHNTFQRVLCLQLQKGASGGVSVWVLNEH